MPQLDPSITITIPVKEDSSAPPTYKSLTVVITDQRPTTSMGEGVAYVAIAMLILSIPAALLVYLLLKIKPSKTTNRILDNIENITGVIDNRVDRGRL